MSLPISGYRLRSGFGGAPLLGVAPGGECQPNRRQAGAPAGGVHNLLIYHRVGVSSGSCSAIGAAVESMGRPVGWNTAMRGRGVTSSRRATQPMHDQ
jgi:hypothetical protein